MAEVMNNRYNKRLTPSFGIITKNHTKHLKEYYDGSFSLKISVFFKCLALRPSTSKQTLISNESTSSSSLITTLCINFVRCLRPRMKGGGLKFLAFISVQINTQLLHSEEKTPPKDMTTLLKIGCNNLIKQKSFNYFEKSLKSKCRKQIINLIML